MGAFLGCVCIFNSVDPDSFSSSVFVEHMARATSSYHSNTVFLQLHEKCYPQGHKQSSEMSPNYFVIAFLLYLHTSAKKKLFSFDFFFFNLKTLTRAAKFLFLSMN